ncbi:MAG: hypothetical protein KDD60_03510 [Bdellovibrionales bacterium]|nr:hypothetical protein [Bdellovibrionales bacterium]
MTICRSAIRGTLLGAVFLLVFHIASPYFIDVRVVAAEPEPQFAESEELYTSPPEPSSSPTPPPLPEECPFYFSPLQSWNTTIAIGTDGSGGEYLIEASTGQTKNILEFDSTVIDNSVDPGIPGDQGLNCLYDVFNNYETQCSATWNTNVMTGYGYDDCIEDAFEADFQKYGMYGSNGYPDAAIVSFFDKDCNPLNYGAAMPYENNEAAAQWIWDNCKALEVWSYCPVSLLWEEGVDVNSDATITNFPLDPTSPGKSFLWKASAKTPLLVFDPQHKGEITSAFQLFGEWTFGGKRDSLANISLDSSQMKLTGKPWENGYEPLALMDTDGDGKISGNELNPIALWFDGNRDGVSQSGEVQPAKKAGVTALYYTPDGRDSQERNIIAIRGFERLKDGEIVLGTSVDWYGEGGDHPIQIADRAMLKGALCNPLSDNVSCTESHHRTQQDQPSFTLSSNTISSADSPITVDNLRGFSGLWMWQATGDLAKSKNRPIGSLFIGQNQEGLISGRSFTSLPVKADEYPSIAKLSSNLLTSLPLEGARHTVENGKSAIEFKVHSEDGKSYTESVAVLANNGKNLIGKSRSVFYTADGQRSIAYSWQASRAKEAMKSRKRG